MERVGDLLKEVIAEVVREVKDPGLGDALISITGVKVTSDLSVARVGVSVLGGEQEQVMAALGRASGFLRREINARVRLRKVPELRFELDQSMEQGARVLALLKEAGLSSEEPPFSEPNED